jgi:uncharacterized Ntn-hydrolase superfamily protein
MTFSLVGRDPRTGQFGAIVTSSSPCVAARCAWARAGVGAACTQNVTDPTLGNALLDRLEAGRSTREAIEDVTTGREFIDYRQLSVIGAAGEGAAFTGTNTLGTHVATVAGRDCVAAGNLLDNPGVSQAMADAFDADPSAHIGDRLLAGLAGGRDAGGEEGPVRSCGLLIVDRYPWPTTDLRVDWFEDDPIEELIRIWQQVWKPQIDDYVTRALDPPSAPSYGVAGDK